MTTVDAPAPETHAFEADVAKLLHLMVHSVYSDKDIFLRELISNAADACEKLRYEAIADPNCSATTASRASPSPPIRTSGRLTIEDNGIGMSARRDGRGARHHRPLRHQGLHGADRRRRKAGEGAQLIGQFGVGFYSAFMVADRVDVISRRAGSERGRDLVVRRQGHLHGPAGRRSADAPARGTRVVLHLMEDAKAYTEPLHARAHRQGAVRPCAGADRRSSRSRTRSRSEIADGAALWTKPKAEISAEEYADFYRSVAGQFDEPALTIHFRAEGPARIYGARLRAGDAAVRPVRSGSQGPHEALRASASSSPTRPSSCRATCASCAASSIPPTCRSTSRAR